MIILLVFTGQFYKHLYINLHFYLYFDWANYQVYSKNGNSCLMFACFENKRVYQVHSKGPTKQYSLPTPFI